MEFKIKENTQLRAWIAQRRKFAKYMRPVKGTKRVTLARLEAMNEQINTWGR